MSVGLRFKKIFSGLIAHGGKFFTGKCLRMYGAIARVGVRILVQDYV